MVYRSPDPGFQEAKGLYFIIFIAISFPLPFLISITTLETIDLPLMDLVVVPSVPLNTRD